MTFTDAVELLQQNTHLVAQPINFDRDNPNKFLVVYESNTGIPSLEYITNDGLNNWYAHTCIPFHPYIDWEICKTTSEQLFSSIEQHGGLHITK